MRWGFMHEVMIDARQGLIQLRRADLSIRPAKQVQLASAGKEFRRAALIHGDMGPGMTQHCARRRAEAGQGQRIRRRAGRRQPIVEIVCTEHSRQLAPQTSCHPVIAIARLEAGIRGEHRFQHFRMRGRRRVGGEIHQICVSGVCHIRCWPPSLAIICPVTLLAETRYRSALTISSGLEPCPVSVAAVSAANSSSL